VIFIVTYELYGPSPDEYKKFYEAIQAQGEWSHYLASTWFISTSKTAQEVAYNLKPHMQGNDRLFVAQMGADNFGWLAKEAWEWIAKHKNS
jgi:hypothetical protein